MLRPFAVDLPQVAAREQVFMDAHGAVVFAAPAKQVAQGKVQLRRIWVALHCFNKGVNGLVLLLVEQEVEPLEVGLGYAAVFKTQLA